MPQPALRELELPPSLNPVTAGRFGLWLLGKRNQARAQTRVGVATREYGSSCLARYCTLVIPWTVYEYPGLHRYLRALLGISVPSATRYVRGQRLPMGHARRLALICRERAAAFEALAADFEALSVERPKGRLRREKRGG